MHIHLPQCTWAAAIGVESAGGLRSTKGLGQPWSRAIGVASPAGKASARDLRQDWARAIDPTNTPAASHVGQAAAQN